jgi:hypothetical protein
MPTSVEYSNTPGGFNTAEVTIPSSVEALSTLVEGVGLSLLFHL